MRCACDLRDTVKLPYSRTGTRRRVRADVAQLVAHHLAKVRVASSSLVIRSSGLVRQPACGVNHSGGVAERRGSGLQSRLHGFESRRHLATHN